MKSTIKKYLSTFSVTGHEDSLAKIISAFMAPICDEIHTDSVGNLICLRRGRNSNKKLMIAAHMDEIGFVVTYIEESGLIRVAKLGGINAVASSFGEVRFENGTFGVLVFENGVKGDDLTVDKMLIDIGAKNRREAERHVSVGDACALVPSLRKLSGSRVTAKATDDRIGCAIVSEAAIAAGTPAYDTYYVFTVQEEVGCRGAAAAANAIMPDYAIAVDVTPSFDIPGSPKLPARIGNGACIKVKDNSVICSQILNKRLAELADGKNIKWQYEILTQGGTDTSKMQLSGCGAHATCISLPIRYVHTPVEVFDLNDFDNCVNLLTEFIVKGFEND